jgi:hypothetical protein
MRALSDERNVIQGLVPWLVHPNSQFQAHRTTLSPLGEPSNGATIRALAPGESGRPLIEAGDACVFCGDWICEGVAESDIFDVSGRRTNPDSGECASI